MTQTTGAVRVLFFIGINHQSPASNPESTGRKAMLRLLVDNGDFLFVL